MIKTQNTKIDWDKYHDRAKLRGNFKFNRKLFIKVKKEIQKNFDIKNILDLGCGNGLVVNELRKCKYKAKGLDKSKSSIRWAKMSYGDNFKQVDIEQIKLPKVDCIISLNLLQYLEEPLVFLENAKSKVKHKLIFVVPLEDKINDKYAKWQFNENDFDNFDLEIYEKYIIGVYNNDDDGKAESKDK